MTNKIKVIFACIGGLVTLTGGAMRYGQHYAKTINNAETAKEIKVDVKANEKDIHTISEKVVQISTTQERSIKVLDELEKRVYNK